MIPKAYIDEWQTRVAWSHDAWVEQDLVICRVIVEMFRTSELARRLAFRGGTALYKLYLGPAARYSEDIDLVQVRAEPIGDTLDMLRDVLDPWLGRPRRQLKKGRVNLVYRFVSEGAPPVQLRLKIEINTREHFSELGLVKVPFRLESRWFAGETEVTTFNVNELLATKLRALYQRKKGRDLFDLSFALQRGVVAPDVLLTCFARYMAEGGRAVSRAQLEANLHGKASDPGFRGDTAPLLRPGLAWDFDAAMADVLQSLVARLPGEPWKGEGPE